MTLISSSLTCKAKPFAAPQKNEQKKKKMEVVVAAVAPVASEAATTAPAAPAPDVSAKKGRGRPRLSDEEKARRKAERAQLKKQSKLSEKTSANGAPTSKVGQEKKKEKKVFAAATLHRKPAVSVKAARVAVDDEGERLVGEIEEKEEEEDQKRSEEEKNEENAEQNDEEEPNEELQEERPLGRSIKLGGGPLSLKRTRVGGFLPKVAVDEDEEMAFVNGMEVLEDEDEDPAWAIAIFEEDTRKLKAAIESPSFDFEVRVGK